jgi:hypothetical protein
MTFVWIFFASGDRLSATNAKGIIPSIGYRQRLGRSIGFIFTCKLIMTPQRRRVFWMGLWEILSALFLVVVVI